MRMKEQEGLLIAWYIELNRAMGYITTLELTCGRDKRPNTKDLIPVTPQAELKAIKDIKEQINSVIHKGVYNLDIAAPLSIIIRELLNMVPALSNEVVINYLPITINISSKDRTQQLTI
jgi:hypothetical protein